MIMALNGFYDHELTVEDAFRANDKNTSGFLDRLEVQCAVAMLGYLVETDGLQAVMDIMDADGGGAETPFCARPFLIEKLSSFATDKLRTSIGRKI